MAKRGAAGRAMSKDHYRKRAEQVLRTYGGAAAPKPFGFANAAVPRARGGSWC